MSEVAPNDVIVFNDYPVSKFGKKIDFWTSPDGLRLISGWRQAGLTIKDICTKMDVDPRTFRSWQKKSPMMVEALCASKEVTDTRVIDALYKRALGYDYIETTQELVEGDLRVTKIVQKHVPPDVKAIMMWLYNRMGQQWRTNQPEIDLNIPEMLNAKEILVRIKKEVELLDEPRN